ncbi:hypothetical protein WICANDRAFT_89794 [Wickerhamomyces anomalus NRRL Y-366-8]|uniref:Uncharacterized protein n=1 Tax=Wickerhamomyces anomalus (strain ATCC 58044 / CBS 1984 / NCYC 433 / NRRL Y-366-8) TaxID=683960 RepID=A0A1E3P5H5_WICAA|nr:uncharacterized protein WICANDRAFT_89794 [Wickerhamomyces anomalus NRRL Y-366-8]ODQ60623.1 hypothetical protein WICANDRAFT_89794 [Wickerhamomyces anomalus NRRL Y-366-8]
MNLFYHTISLIIAFLSIAVVQCDDAKDEAALRQELSKNQVNITARDSLIPFINHHRLGITDKVALSMIASSDFGITLGGIIPYCTNENFGPVTFGSTTGCVLTLLSGLTMFNGALLMLFSGLIPDKFNGSNLVLDPPIFDNKWSKITRNAYQRGLEIESLYYKGLIYDNEEVVLDDFHVVYTVDGFQINKFNNSDSTYKKVSFQEHASFLTSLISNLQFQKTSVLHALGWFD